MHKPQARFWAAAIALVVVLAVTPARADGFYLGPEGGWTHLEDSITRRADGSDALVIFRHGFNIGARGGYEWGAWRFEGEFSYRRNKASASSHGIVPLLPPTPGFKLSDTSYSGMANIIHDFQLGVPITPHIGAGIGVASVHRHVTVPPVGITVDGSDTVFAYQGIAGFRYDINPSLALDLDYRYFATTSPHYVTAAGLAGHGGANIGLKTDYKSHNLVASLIFKFGPPPSPPAPSVASPLAGAPAPASRLFLVFFDWDRDAITPEGIRIIDEAAAAYRAGASVRIQVTGYTDRSGSPGYNQRLSERRAENVANALARLGVPRTAMAVSGRGENDNRVPTAGGVREPQNRRVEIGFQ